MPDFKQPVSIILNDERATKDLANNFSEILNYAPIILFLRGDLGTGKTCFTRYLLEALGVKEKVKSPTYTLVETYAVDHNNIYHFDLYRAADPRELETLGFRDYLQDYALIIIEWAENGHGCLPSADLEIALEALDDGRKASIMALTPKGISVLQHVGNI